MSETPEKKKSDLNDQKGLLGKREFGVSQRGSLYPGSNLCQLSNIGLAAGLRPRHHRRRS